MGEMGNALMEEMNTAVAVTMVMNSLTGRATILMTV